MTLAVVAGVAGPLVVIVAAVVEWRHRNPIPLVTKLVIAAAVVCLIWNVGFWILFLFAYRQCPDGVC